MGREIRQKQAYLRQHNRLWPAAMIPVPLVARPPSLGNLKAQPLLVYRSCKFLAQVFDELNGARRISVQRTMIDDEGNWLQGMNWDDLMRVKNECGYFDCWAVEIFPPINEVVNVANMRHIFLLPNAPAFA